MEKTRSKVEIPIDKQVATSLDKIAASQVNENSLKAALESIGEENVQDNIQEYIKEVENTISADDRLGTPQYLVRNDRILSHRVFKGDEHVSMDQEAADFMNKLYIKRNAFVEQNAVLDYSQDLYDYDDINMSGLMQKPRSFMIVGKPGVGATTFGTRFAEKMNLVYLSPSAVVNYFAGNKYLETGGTDESMEEFLTQYQSQGLDDHLIFKLICQRMQAGDVSYRGYILDGWPMVRSEDISIAQQLEMTKKMPIRPDFMFIMQMQDRDLFRRRVDQKLDPLTMEVYTKNQYIRTSLPTSDPKGFPSQGELTKYSKGSLPTYLTSSISTESSTTLATKDKVNEKQEAAAVEDSNDSDSYTKIPLPSEVLGRLISRLEDHPAHVKRDFDKFNKAIPIVQSFINAWDRTKVFELDPYWAPHTIVKNAMSIMKALGVYPSTDPIEIFRPAAAHNQRLRPEDQIEGYSSDEEGLCIPDPNDNPPGGEEFTPDWVAVMRSVVVRGRIDPRFRWRISKWNNICPVALKEGRSTSGRPELAYGFHDKVYFLSSPEAVEKFKFNPKQYLLPSMPTSPVKLFIIGQPLTGKTMFATELASLIGGKVIDMKRETAKKLDQIKQRYIFKARFDATREAKQSINKKNYDEWKHQERNRRRKAHKWITDYIRRKAAEEINKVLELERDKRMNEYRKLRKKSEGHHLKTPFKDSPCTAEPLAFSWKKFVEDIKKGVETWNHQDKLELAWELFNEGKLQYKSNRKGRVILVRNKKGKSDGDNLSIVGESDSEGKSEEEEDESVAGESADSKMNKGDNETKKKRRRRKKRPYCSELAKGTGEIEISVLIDDEDSPFEDSDDEPDESLRIRYPSMCQELTETVPKPDDVSDQNEQVQEFVKLKVEEIEKWIGTMPTEIYEEILLLSLNQAEEIFHNKFPCSHFSGGWIVENLVSDVEKWRGVLRNSKLCPDQIVVLQDNSDDFSQILARSTFLYMKNKSERKKSSRRISVKRESGVLGGEDGDGDLDTFEDDVEVVPEPSSDANRDNLWEFLCETKSGFNQLQMDKQRAQSIIVSPRTSESQYKLEETLLNHSSPSPRGDHLNIEYAKLCGRLVDSRGPCTNGLGDIISMSTIMLKSNLASTRKMVPFEISIVVPLEEVNHLHDTTGVIAEDDKDSEGGKSIILKDSVEAGEDEEEIENERESQSRSGSGSDSGSARVEFRGEGEDEDDVMSTALVSSTSQERKSTIPPPPCLPGEEDTDPADCDPTEAIASLKKKLQKQISAFNEFLNMVFPVINEQKVHHLELGFVEESNLKETVTGCWEGLEARFKMPPKPVTAGELEEDNVDLAESNALWSNTKIDPTESGEASEYEENYNEVDESENDNDSVDRSRMKESSGYRGATRKQIEEMENNRLFGDLGYYCPVTLHDHQLIRRGSPKWAVRYQDRLYYMVNEAAVSRFTENPSQFLRNCNQKCIPPPRICITGAPGCGQKDVAIKMCRKVGIFYINFRDRLQELVKSRIGHYVGPFLTCEIVTKSDRISDTSAPVSKTASYDLATPGKGYETESVGEIFDPNMEWIKEKNERREMEILALKSLGRTQNMAVDGFPMCSIERSEVKADETISEEKLTTAEKYFKDFLECGTQLPPFVLDEFILSLWNEEPFKSKGFILDGFPNTAKDVQYMVDKMCVPEKVYVMECQAKTCRNRLIEECMNNVQSKLKTVEVMNKKYVHEHKNRLSNDYNADFVLLNKMTHLDNPDHNERPEANKYNIKAGKALYHHHYIWTEMNDSMKAELSHRMINWLSINTDFSLFEGANKLRTSLTPALEYRVNFFEMTYVLYAEEAETLLQNHYFHLSRFRRWCPVEISKGNQGINLWNAPGVIKYPVLYRNYIYFIAGKKNLSTFCEQVLYMTQQMTPMPSVPFYITLIGPLNSGKSELASRLAENLGLLHIREEKVVEQIIKHSYASLQDKDILNNAGGPQVMSFAQKVFTYLKSGHSIPRYMYYECLSYTLMDPLAQHHGCVFDGYPTENEAVQELLERGVIPAVVARMDISVETSLQRCERKRRIPNYNFQHFVQDCDEVITQQHQVYGPLTSPCIYRYGNQMQCLIPVDGLQNPATIYETVADKCFAAQTLKQRYVLRQIHSKL